eukprot:5884057-Alexandrium_andersonii.AAC.1
MKGVPCLKVQRCARRARRHRRLFGSEAPRCFRLPGLSGGSLLEGVALRATRRSALPPWVINFHVPSIAWLEWWFLARVRRAARDLSLIHI